MRRHVEQQKKAGWNIGSYVRGFASLRWVLLSRQQLRRRLGNSSIRFSRFGCRRADKLAGESVDHPSMAVVACAQQGKRCRRFHVLRWSYRRRQLLSVSGREHVRSGRALAAGYVPWHRVLVLDGQHCAVSGNGCSGCPHGFLIAGFNDVNQRLVSTRRLTDGDRNLVALNDVVRLAWAREKLAIAVQHGDIGSCSSAFLEV